MKKYSWLWYQIFKKKILLLKCLIVCSRLWVRCRNYYFLLEIMLWKSDHWQQSLPLSNCHVWLWCIVVLHVQSLQCFTLQIFPIILPCLILKVILFWSFLIWMSYYWVKLQTYNTNVHLFNEVWGVNTAPALVGKCSGLLTD